MADIKALLRNLRQNPPPLHKSESKKEIVLIGPNSTSIIDKLHNHQKVSTDEDTEANNDQHKWHKIKEKMIVDMESKRDEEWQKEKQMKLEDEEIDDENDGIEALESDCSDKEVADVDDVDDVDTVDSLVFRHIEESGKDDQNEDDDYRDEAEDNDEDDNEIVENDSNEDVNDDDLLQDDSEDKEDAVSQKKRTKVFQIDDDESENESAENNEENIQEKTLDEIDTNEIGNHFEHNHELYPLFDQQNYISQNLALTQPLSQKMDQREINGQEDKKFDEFKTDSQMLVDLCSGQFGDVPINEDPVEDDSVGEGNDDSEHETDDEENGDEESEDDCVDEEEVVVSKRSKMGRQFIEDEAELSGDEDDVSSDEHEDDDDDELEYDQIDENLPSDDELRKQVEKIYNKKQLDEDKRQLMILKERFFEDGDLHEEGGNRKRKFKWTFDEQEMDHFTNVLSDSENSEDDDSDAEANDNSEDRGQIRLKTISDNQDSSAPVTTTIEPATDNCVELKPVSKPKMFERKVVKKRNMSITSFVVRDERLKLLINNKSTSRVETSNKKLKTQESRMSIFDVLQC